MDNNSEEKKSRSYKIEVGDKIKIHRKDINGRPIYSTRVKQKLLDGTMRYFSKTLNFKSDVNIVDGEIILIKKMFENIRENPKDPYNPIFSLFILDFDKIKSKSSEEEQAINEYKSYVEIMQDNRDYFSNDDIQF